MVAAANVCFPDDNDDRFGDVGGEAIEAACKALGICDGPLADEVQEVIQSLVTFN